MSRRPLRIKVPGADYEFRVIGVRRTPLRDFYHRLLRAPWWVTFGIIGAAFLTANALFAGAYVVSGGVERARAGSFLDAFFFSVQTMGTIGYGAMYPEGTAAQVLVVLESLTSLILTALATGLVFAKFSRSTARVVFSRQAVIAPMNGQPTLMLRFGNERGNLIVDAQIHLALVRTERLAEGGVFYRTVDLKLARDRALSLQRTWIALHPIDEESPLYGATPASLLEAEAELQILVVGLDDTTMQTVHASHRYYAKQIIWGARHADVLSETPDAMILDLRKFHDVEPTEPTPTFPYRADPRRLLAP